MARLAEQLGKPLMPWQRLAADIGLEYELVDGLLLPAYREVIVTVMRQQGKSTLTFTVVGHRCVMWRRLPQRVIYTAQDGSAARGKLFNDATPLWQGSPTVSRLVERVYRGVGPFEGVHWRTGSRVGVIGSSESAGHGMTETGLAVIDESFADVDDRREQAISPSMATQADAQTWNVSTAGTAESVFLRRKVDAGRAAAEAGETSGIAYLEWSIPADADVDDPGVWWEFMPALGWTIGEDVVRHARRTMSDNDWRRSFGNQWTSVSERAIPVGVWEAACSPAVAPSGGLRFVVEAHPDRSSACVVVAGGGVVELVDHRAGVGWVVDRLVELAGRHAGVVRVDGGGPAGVFVPELEAAGVRLETFGAREVVRACGAFYDALADARVKIRSSPVLDAAAAGVGRRQVGDGWAWTRRHVDTDVYPIMAASLAFFDATTPPARVAIVLGR